MLDVDASVVGTHPVSEFHVRRENDGMARLAGFSWLPPEKDESCAEIWDFFETQMGQKFLAKHVGEIMGCITNTYQQFV